MNGIAQPLLAMKKQRFSGNLFAPGPNRLGERSEAVRFCLLFPPFVKCPAGIKIAGQKRADGFVPAGIGEIGFERDGPVIAFKRVGYASEFLQRIAPIVISLGK